MSDAVTNHAAGELGLDQGAETRSGLPRALAAARSCLGPAFVVVTFLALLAKIVKPIDPYDEGIALTDSLLVVQGALPYRDYYTNYPPAIFLMVASLWKVTGVSILAARALGVFVLCALAFLSGRLAARVAGNTGGRGFGWLSAGLVLGSTVDLGGAPRAWFCALTLAFAFCELTLLARERGGWRWAAAGLCLGGVGCFRHDLFVYVVLTLVVSALVRRVRGGTLPSAKTVLGVAAVAALPILAVWGSAILAASFERVWLDQVVEIARHMGSRKLPWTNEAGSWQLWVVAAAPLVGALTLVLHRGNEALLMVTALSVAVLPYASGRTDLPHLIAALAPGLVLLPACLPILFERVPGGSFGRALHVAFVLAIAVPNVHTPYVRKPAYLEWTPVEGIGRVPETSLDVPGRRDVLRYLATETAPGEPIFVGLPEHRVMHCNEMDLYFLAQRPGATRWMQFDPGLTNREDIQREIVADFERSGLRVAVLRDCGHGPEPNQSSVPGSTVLDDYLAERFALAEEFEGYRVLVRR